jgi:hypothetical protein
MSEHRSQHRGRRAGDQQSFGSDTVGPESIRSSSYSEFDDTHAISRLIDQNEGYDRQDHRSPRSGGSRGRRTGDKGR